MFAVVYIGGKQYKVQEKDELRVEKIDTEEGKNLKITEVMLVADETGKDVKIGMPYVSGAQVECQVIEQGRGDKVNVFKMKPKKRYSVKQGHRQSYTLLKVLKISTVGAKKSAPKKEEAKAEKAPAKKTTKKSE